MRSLSRILLFLAALVSFGAAAGENYYFIDAEEWAMPRHGERLAAHPELRALVAAAGVEGVITISHGGGETGVLWAAELRDWLVALGLPSARIAISPDGPVDGTIRLAVASAGGGE